MISQILRLRNLNCLKVLIEWLKKSVMNTVAKKASWLVNWKKLLMVNYVL